MKTQQLARAPKTAVLSIAIAITILNNAHADTITLLDNTNYTKGSNLTYISPWGKGSLVYGVDYSESATIDTSVYPNNQFITWSWPMTPAPSGVYGCLHSDYGNYMNGIVQIPIASKQVKAINTLTVSHDLKFSGANIDGYDVIYNFFLTKQAANFNTIQYEIGIFVHTPPFSVTYANSSKAVGVTTISGIQWNVSVNPNAPHGPYSMFIPSNGADIQAATIDVRQILAYLVGKRQISNLLYFNGVGLGAEPRFGGGSLTINAMSATYN
jgi:hypothetical protein